MKAREAAATLALSEDCLQPKVKGTALRSGLPSKRTLALRDENGCAGSALRRLSETPSLSRRGRSTALAGMDVSLLPST